MNGKRKYFLKKKASFTWGGKMGKNAFFENVYLINQAPGLKCYTIVL